ncbi:MAG TPA: GGDEF domain-containing protein, partial [Actinotalea sp.]|nr:GGDEF domain-containing protein [Actinotalea sp.]
MGIRPRWSARSAEAPAGLGRVILWATPTVLAALVFVGAALIGERATAIQAALAGLHAAGAAAVLVRAATVSAERRAWSAIGAAVAVVAAADAVWALAGGGYPAPAAALLLYVVAVPLLYGGLVSLVPRGRDLNHPRFWLDALICALALAGALTAAIDRWLTPSVTSATGRVLVMAIPAVDLVLITLLLSALLIAGPRYDGRLPVLLVAGLALGTGHLLAIAAGRGTAGAPTLAAALTATPTVLLVVAAWTRLPRATYVPPPGWLVQGAPMVSLSVAIAIVCAGGLGDMPPVSVLAATLALVLMVARLNFTLLDERRAATEAERLASIDTLTGLANRRSFAVLAEARLAEAAGTRRSVALLMADLDEFKEVNDRLGHHAGDKVLVTVARRFQDALSGRGATLAGFSGDDSAILVDADRATAERICQEIVAAVAAPVWIDGVSITPTLSIGVALAPQDASELGLLLRRADIAMYRAKARSQGYAAYDPTLGDPDGEDR